MFNLDIHRSVTVPAMRSPHRHQEVEVNYLEAGQAIYLIGGVLRTVTARRFSFFWGAMPHRLIEASEDASGFWYLTIPLTWVMAWDLSPALTRGLLDGELLADRREHLADPAKLVDWHDALHRDARHEKAMLLELEARFRRFTIDNPTLKPLGASQPRAAYRQIERLARHIVENYRTPLSLSDIAAAADLHPNYAASLFRKHCGQTLLQCLTQHRIAHAQRMLATTSAKVIDVSADSGFGSLSQFYESFVRHCHETPSAYRKRFVSRMAASEAE